MKTCRCGKTFRRGARVLVVGDDRKLRPGTVCPACEREALRIVLAPPPPPPVRAVRNPQLDAIKRKIEMYRARASGAGMDPVVEAFDQCLQLVALAQEGRPL